MNELYEYLDKHKLSKFDNLPKKIFEDKLDNLIEHLGNLFYLSNQNESYKGRPSFFDFVANDSLSGGDVLCASPGCRIRKADELISFSLLYSKSVLITNPFDFFYYYHSKGFVFENEQQEEFFRNKILGAILIILRYKELIKRSIIRVNNTIHPVCESCLKEIHKIEQETADKLFSYAMTRIIPRLSDLSIEMDTDHSIVIKGLGEYLSINEYALRFARLPQELVPFKDKVPIKLPESMISTSMQRLVEQSITSLLMQKLDPYEGKRFTYLTNNKIETEMINHLNKDYKRKNTYSFNLVQGLSHSAPFIRDIPIKKLIELREYEEDSFNRYQESIRKIIIENNIKSQKEFKEAMNEIVNPEVEKLERMFKLREKHFNKSQYKNVAIETASVVIGLIFNPDPASKAVNLFKDFLLTVNNILSTEDAYKNLDMDLKENNYYFLWKAKNTH